MVSKPVLCLLFVGFWALAHGNYHQHLQDFVNNAPEEVIDDFIISAADDAKDMTVEPTRFEGQLLDHYDLLDKRNWSQRYWQYDNYFDNTQGSVLLYVCGEYVCPGLPQERGWPGVLAKIFKSRVYVVEHRFYGESQPFENDGSKGGWDVDNLRYLTIEQALADLAVFVATKKEEIASYFDFEPKWYVVGGSYPGALSAWFRTLYPNLVEASLASSAVVHTFANYPQYDHQVRQSLLESSQECAANVRDISNFAEFMLNNSPETKAQIKKVFKGETLEDTQFLFYVADIMATRVQYGGRTALCSAIKADSFKESFTKAVKYLDDNGYLDPTTYELDYLKDTNSYNDRASRQWLWQKCLQVGFFQTADMEDPERSTVVDFQFKKRRCVEVFGQTIEPNENLTNTMLQGGQNEGRRIIFTNGGEDPWQWASLRKANNVEQIPMVIHCEDCAHCVDLATPKPTDAATLKAARRETLRKLTEWLLQQAW